MKKIILLLIIFTGTCSVKQDLSKNRKDNTKNAAISEENTDNLIYINKNGYGRSYYKRYRTENFWTRYLLFGDEPSCYDPPSTDELSDEEKKILKNKYPYGDIKLATIHTPKSLPSDKTTDISKDEKTALVEAFAIIRYIMNSQEFEDAIFSDEFIPVLLCDIDYSKVGYYYPNLYSPGYPIDKSRFLRLIRNISFNVEISRNTQIVNQKNIEVQAIAQTYILKNYYALDDELEKYWLKTGQTSLIELLFSYFPDLTDKTRFKDSEYSKFTELISTLMHELAHNYGYSHADNTQNFYYDPNEEIVDQLEHLIRGTELRTIKLYTEHFDSSTKTFYPDQKYHEIISIYRKLYKNIIEK